MTRYNQRYSYDDRGDKQDIPKTPIKLLLIKKLKIVTTVFQHILRF